MSKSSNISNHMVATTQHATAQYTSRQQAHDHRYSQLQECNGTVHQHGTSKQAPVQWMKKHNEKQQTKHQYLAKILFSQIYLPVVYKLFHYCQPMETWRLNMFSCELKAPSIKRTVVSYITFYTVTPLYTLYSCERYSIRNVSNLPIC